MRLRRLEQKDAFFMFEWMHDDSVVHYMGTDFSEKTVEDCLGFIDASQADIPNVHRAIVNEDDEYMGTVSLKNVDAASGSAEFAITVRKSAMGKGYSKYGMEEIIRMGFEKFKLETIYWYVSKKNARAIRFYEKNSFEQVDVKSIINWGGGTQKKKFQGFTGTRWTRRPSTERRNRTCHTIEYESFPSFADGNCIA